MFCGLWNTEVMTKLASMTIVSNIFSQGLRLRITLELLIIYQQYTNTYKANLRMYNIVNIFILVLSYTSTIISYFLAILGHLRVFYS